MKFKREQLVALLAEAGPVEKIGINELLNEYVTVLADVSKKLNKDDMTKLMAVAMALVQHTTDELPQA